MTIHYDIRIQGKVQKVGFRFHAHLEATRNNLKGFVRNESEGGVYIEVEGEEAELKSFIEWCQQGPPMAIIENVEVKKAALMEYDRFSIRH